MTYYYGEEDQNVYTETDYESCADHIDELEQGEYTIIVEMKPSKTEFRWCTYYNYFDPEPREWICYADREWW